MINEYRKSCGIIVNRGHQCFDETIRGIGPARTPPHGMLKLVQEPTNKRISSERILVDFFPVGSEDCGLSVVSSTGGMKTCMTIFFVFV